jgi:hypothetical protein
MTLFRLLSCVAIGAFAPRAVAGTIHGTVVFTGKRPASASVPIDHDQRNCGNSQPDESLLVDGKGGLANAVVFIEHAPKGPAGELRDASLDQVACRFTPHVLAVRAGAGLVAVNSDATLHTVHGVLDGRNLFNHAMPLKGMKKRVVLSEPGLVKATCDAGHAWMSAWIYVFDHPYFAVTGADGSFEIQNLPPGTYSLAVWQEKLGVVRRTVVVADPETNVSLTMR